MIDNMPPIERFIKESCKCLTCNKAVDVVRIQRHVSPSHFDPQLRIGVECHGQKEYTVILLRDGKSDNDIDYVKYSIDNAIRYGHLDFFKPDVFVEDKNELNNIIDRIDIW